jgi:hypothetical protein
LTLKALRATRLKSETRVRPIPALLGPGFLGEGGVDGDGDHVGAKLFVLVEEAGHLAELIGADAGEGEGHEKDDGLALADVAAEVDVDQTGRRSSA